MPRRYDSKDVLHQHTLNAVWRVDPKDEQPSLSTLDPDIINQMCLAEEESLNALQQKGLCFGCQDGKCLPPHSLIRMVRSFVTNGHLLDCRELAVSYNTLRTNFTDVLAECVDDIKMNWTYADKYKYVTKCPTTFIPPVLDKQFGKSNTVARYAISYFPTYRDKQSRTNMFENVEMFDRSDGNTVLAAYDTSMGFFLESYVTKTSQKDMVRFGFQNAYPLYNSCLFISVSFLFLLLSTLLAFSIFNDTNKNNAGNGSGIGIHNHFGNTDSHSLFLAYFRWFVPDHLIISTIILRVLLFWRSFIVSF